MTETAEATQEAPPREETAKRPWWLRHYTFIGTAVEIGQLIGKLVRLLVCQLNRLRRHVFRLSSLWGCCWR
jgi:hypothetical protein